MTRTLMICLAFAAPLPLMAMPAVGDMVGTNPTDATAALKAAGCTVQEFEAEDRMIEAKCMDETQKHWEVYIDPAKGTITNIKADD